MSDDIPCNNCGVKFSDVEQLRKDAYDSDQDFWRMNELFIKKQAQLKEAEKVIDFYAWSFSEECELHDEYDIKFVGSQSGRKAREYKAKYNKDKG